MENDNLGNLLSEVTQTAENSNTEQIVYIDIGELETNPRNFYGLRDVDSLAGLIAVSHLIEPLTVIKKAEGKYRIISGHRRKAAVEKLLEEGVYTERKLPCIVKTLGKITIEQENGDTIEFDEDAVEMLTLIASNRGQREERTVDEKLQEIKSLEGFAKAIYHQKNRRARGRFRNFFAEEVLNISKSQLQRINAMENLTDKVKQAVDEKKISETAAMAMSNMTAEEQDACLEKVMSGEIKGTVQDIQNLKSSKDVAGEPFTENLDDDVSVDELATETVSEEMDSAAADSSAEIETVEESTAKLTYPKNLIPETETASREKLPLPKIIDVPEQFDDPQKEANDWIYQEGLAFYEMIYSEAKRLSEEEEDELRSAQWGIRASVARYKIEELKLQHNEQM